MQTIKKTHFTGNRILSVLNMLNQDARSTNELVSFLDCSFENVRSDILTLQNAGFEIEKVGSKYFSKFRCGHIYLTKNEFHSLNYVKNTIIAISNWKFTLNLYKVFEKIAGQIANEEYASTLMNFGYFSNIDFKLIRELDYHCERQNEIIVCYRSPKDNQKTAITIRCAQIRHDKNTNKMHLFGQFENYPDTSFLRIDKILYIKNVKKTPTLKYSEKKLRHFKFKREFLSDFRLEDNESIVKIDDNSIKIEAVVVNDFYFMQRLMVLGENLIDADCDIKKMLIENLIKIKGAQNGM